MELQKILSLIPAKVLEELALESDVDYFTKKLQGEVVFKLLLHCIISHKDNSLRTMKSAYETIFFQLINRKHHQGSISISSISERLSTIDATYFEQLYRTCVRLYKQEIGKDAATIIRFDSTLLALSTKLLSVGYHLKSTGGKNFRQLKFTIGYTDIPEIVHFYTEQSYNAENLALKETIMEQSKNDSRSIKIFDRGITSRKTYDMFTDNGIKFISRINATSKYDNLKANNLFIQLPIETATLKIISDTQCQLYGKQGLKPKHLVRRIEAISLADNERIVFVTNIDDLPAVDITELYKRRWDIEVFFKFIKQLLNFKHLVNRSNNGIKVVLYVTMIATVILAAYKKLNHLNGYKIPKQKFTAELETELVKHLITMCGGNPEKLNKILLRNTS